ncbi:MAG: UbiA prenyltransferase family protein [Thaumarchaeota archaeon]|nr:UbiA prenyltransferase family protein [Nitrososphaerota archaeon]
MLKGGSRYATFRSYFVLIRSEKRVVIFVWALFASIVIASGRVVDPTKTLMAIVAMYCLSLSVYLLNDLMDIDEDKVNSPNRPLASGKATEKDASILIVITGPLSLILAYLINPLTLILFTLAMILGLSYSLPKVRAKERFPHKVLVASAGAAISSLTGGTVAGSISPGVILAAGVFALFAQVTLLLGDLADVKGDILRGIKSFPIVLGSKITSRIIQSIPPTIFTLTIGFQVAFYPSITTPLLIGALCFYCCVTMKDLAKKCTDYGFCRLVKGKMRTVHLVLQLSLMIGAVTF